MQSGRTTVLVLFLICNLRGPEAAFYLYRIAIHYFMLSLSNAFLINVFIPDFIRFCTSRSVFQCQYGDRYGWIYFNGKCYNFDRSFVNFRTAMVRRYSLLLYFCNRLPRWLS